MAAISAFDTVKDESFLNPMRNADLLLVLGPKNKMEDAKPKKLDLIRGCRHGKNNDKKVVNVNAVILLDLLQISLVKELQGERDQEK